ncbi:MAG: HipA domain-containing protein [Deltaproteobacteria bacterium]|nr:HipA domain-containing protein [Deltaproteobacteria bacterium]MDQ3297141.1 HipA domain-containing protein [Myxococcota bacterium]
MNACWACLRAIDGGSRYHTGCLRELFGVTKAPAIDVELAKLHTLALAMVGHTSLSGIQRKISLRLAAESRTLQVAADGGLFILKPQAQTFPSLPENEHVTMRIAQRVGITMPPCALIELKDGSLAYIVKRFDRLEGGRKLQQEDFCQLAGKAPKDKYTGSAELCAKLVLRYASAPIVDAQRLFRVLAFTWWTGNGDMHLKNFSLLRGEDGMYRLSPAYDLLSTVLVIVDDQLALSVGGTKKQVGRKKWLDLAAQCQLKPVVAERVLRELRDATDDAITLIEASLLPADMKAAYRELVRERAAAWAR